MLATNLSGVVSQPRRTGVRAWLVVALIVTGLGGGWYWYRHSPLTQADTLPSSTTEASQSQPVLQNVKVDANGTIRLVQ
ncbi:hypothetical protein HY524_02180 [Candidatus Berkelbacteria bacterium]|nr:hypothetical protein [Candidatus Berkelbacteria bacterium]